MQDLIDFFKDREIPSEPIKVSKVVTIQDPKLFVSTHLSIIKSNGDKKFIQPYLQRLLWLRQYLQKKEKPA